ncbi:hypothetical protein [Streptomyces sp. NRRL B-3229]|uniref:hypothetical protein n=1 Tax=Streptomyces sp. NRRL B-3229 TaxID=1463836 RepID=UPI00131AD201|nr:hypothetical protein [Streptomyces sp. NRRL B-3229]
MQIDISGRIDGTAEVHRMVALLLEHGGVAIDDYTPHPWTLPEIVSGTVIDGLRFFHFRGYHERIRGHGRPDSLTPPAQVHRSKRVRGCHQLGGHS